MPAPLKAPDLGEWLGITGAVMSGVFGYYMLIGAVRTGEMSVVTPFRYTRLIFALILGWIAFGEAPDGATLIGGAVIVGSGSKAAGAERLPRAMIDGYLGAVPQGQPTLRAALAKRPKVLATVGHLLDPFAER